MRLLRLALLVVFVIASAPAVGARVAAATVCTSTTTATTTVYLPNITRRLGGALGWDTPIYVQNAGAVQAQVDVAFFRFSDGAPVACHTTRSVAPGTSLLDDPNAAADLPDDSQFSVVVKSYGSPVVAIVNQQQGAGTTQQALSYAGFTTGATTVYLPNVTRAFFGYDVPLIVQNLGTAQANVTAKFVSFDGTVTMQFGRFIEPGRSKVIDPDSDDPVVGAPGLVSGRQYAVTLTASQPIGVIANAYTKSGPPVAFSHNGLSSGATSLFAPYAMKTASLFSPVVVQNVGSAPVIPTLTFTPLGGGAPQSFVLPAIPVGGAQAFDPRFTLNTTTPCQTAVASACLGPGEFSLVITAATPIAAVVLPNSATTAAGYLASATPNNRALLPAVMRTVGGPNGWTGTFYVQSAGASQATVRWFSVQTGDLVVTQQLVLQPGLTTRVDPRSIAGLAENTTYSVTIDANSPIATVVFEQAATGGDASMMYEGSSQPTLPATGLPGSLRISPANATVAVGGAQQFTVSMLDQFGAPMVGPFVTATLAPSTLGSVTVSTTAVTFTASGVGGSGTLTVTSGSATASATISVTVPSTVTVGGITFQTSTNGLANVYTETTVSPVDRAAIVTQVNADGAAIQTDFARTFVQKPRVYVFATTTSYTLGLQSILFFPASEAQSAGQASAGVFDPDSGAIAADWNKISGSRPYTTFRHELTHAMEHQIVIPDVMPAWFDEGTARSEEFTIAGSEWKAMVNNYGAASMAALNALLTFPDMTSQATWNSRVSPALSFQYYEASRAIQFIKADLGQAGFLRILALMGSGQTFDAAYASVAGQPFSSFAAAFPVRVRNLSTAYPAITTARGTPDGGGLSFYLYGFPANSAVTIIVSGTASSAPLNATVSQYGTYFNILTDTWPNGSYGIQANWSGGIVTVQAVKTSTTPTPSVSLDPGVFTLDAAPTTVPLN